MPKYVPRFLEDVSSSIKAFAQLERLVALANGLVIPTVVGAFCTYYTDLTKINPILFWGPVVFLVLFAAVCSVTALSVKSAPESLLEIMQLEEKIQGLESAVSHLANVEGLCTVWRAAVDEYITRGLQSPAQAHEAIGVLCELFVNAKDELYHFSTRELWNFAAYLYDAKTGELQPVWRAKHPSHPSSGMGRAWKSGQGHVGIAFSNAQQRITADATVPQIAQLLRAPDASLQRYDDTTYVSIHAEPINSTGTRPYGVLVATSDRAGRFEVGNGLALTHLAGELSSLLTLAYKGAALI